MKSCVTIKTMLYSKLFRRVFICILFLKGLLCVYSMYFVSVVFSPFWEHVLAFWDKRKEQNFLFTTYGEINQVVDINL